MSEMETFEMFSKPQPESMQVILSTCVQGVFREFLESKHLYQSVQVDFSINEIETIKKEKTLNEMKQVLLLQQWSSLCNANWIAHNPDSPPENTSSLLENNIFFRPPDIKIFCAHCDRIEAFNLISSENFLARGKATNFNLQNRSGFVVQVFVLSFVCQSCKSIPEVFLIRREGSRITLSGRTPIEHVEVPKVIPKAVSRFYSGAIVAHQSGQTLAGNFLLRTLLEQFANTKPTTPQSADDTIDQYMNTLPKDFKARFPSFRDLYSTLSADIHSAKGSPDVFDDSITKIIEHFEARKLYKL